MSITGLSRDEIDAMERVSLGMVALLEKERDKLTGGRMLYAIVTGAAAAVQSMTPPSMAISPHNTLAMKAGEMLTESIISFRGK